VEPLLRDPAIDRAMDLAPYRARRILFSWTAYALGLGRPAWILQAYAVQNVLAWLLLAWVLLKWLPPTGVRPLVGWLGILYTHGLLASVRLSLLDGPSLLLIAAAVRSLAAGRPLVSAGVIGLAGLGRETNLLAAAALPAARRWTRKEWGTATLQALLVVLPLLLWTDYLYSIYRSTAFAGEEHLATPFAAYLTKWRATVVGVQSAPAGPAWQSLAALVGLTVQGATLASRLAWRDGWWRIGMAYLILMLLVHSVVWDGHPGAVTRVVLPLTAAFNIHLPEGRWFWPTAIAGNLTVLPGLAAIGLL
jgi:hypothetical protein